VPLPQASPHAMSFAPHSLVDFSAAMNDCRHDFVSNLRILWLNATPICPKPLWQGCSLGSTCPREPPCLPVMPFITSCTLIFNRLLASSVRHDGRAFAMCRDMRLSSDIVHAVLSSASISIGRTVVIAGMQAVPGPSAHSEKRFVVTFQQ
jgi:hypothetical protein